MLVGKGDGEGTTKRRPPLFTAPKPRAGPCGRPRAPAPPARTHISRPPRRFSVSGAGAHPLSSYLYRSRRWGGGAIQVGGRGELQGLGREGGAPQRGGRPTPAPIPQPGPPPTGAPPPLPRPARPAHPAPFAPPLHSLPLAPPLTPHPLCPAFIFKKVPPLALLSPPRPAIPLPSHFSFFFGSRARPAWPPPLWPAPRAAQPTAPMQQAPAPLCVCPLHVPAMGRRSRRRGGLPRQPPPTGIPRCRGSRPSLPAARLTAVGGGRDTVVALSFPSRGLDHVPSPGSLVRACCLCAHSWPGQEAHAAAAKKSKSHGGHDPRAPL